MYKKWCVVVLLAMAVEIQNQIANRQLPEFKRRTKGPIGVITTFGGVPVEVHDTTSLNKPLLLNEFYLDYITHMVREKIPERIVHAKGGGAFGYFEVTHDIKHICKAKIFSHVGKKTPIAARFSPVVIEKGGSDTTRDARGFAIKFYTEEGNFDIVGFNTPVFGVKDPVMFPAFVKTQKRNPATQLFDTNMMWDFISLRPESLLIFMMLLSDRGIPDGYRHMPGYAIHTYEVVNDKGEVHFIRFHFLPDAGIRNLRSAEAATIAGSDPDYAIRDLYNSIGNEEFPTWSVKIQVLTPEDVKKAGFDVFDVTKLLPVDKYPLRPLGKMVLNKNPINYFAEIEQLAFSPVNLVPGILGGPDKLFEARRLAYRDAQYYRLGTNFYKIPVNCPLMTVSHTYNRDGRAPVLENERDIPNYYPNSFNGPMPYKDGRRVELNEVLQDETNNFEQAIDFYNNGMSKDERERLIENTLSSLGGVIPELQERVVKLFSLVHPDLGRRVEAGLRANTTRMITSRSGQEPDCEECDY